MRKSFCSLFIFFVFGIGQGFYSGNLMANNIRITRDVQVNPGLIVSNIAVIDFAVEWDNSWRDDFNWDAAYIFLKYKKKQENEWKHVLLKTEGHSVSGDYDWVVNSYTPTVDYGTGVFIQRKANGKGRSSIDIKLKWLITRNGLTVADFYDKNIECTAMAVEMVYVPNGAFWLGDGFSDKTFKTNSRSILPQYDLIRNDGTQKYSASGNVNSVDYKKNPPEFAADRISESKNTLDNAWYATTADAYWQVEFDTPKSVQYFGVSGVTGRQSNRPTSWSFQGSNNGRDWIELRRCSQEEWTIINSANSYPVPVALKIDPSRVKSYKFYQIKTISGTVRPMLNNVSMTEANLDTMVNNAYLVEKQGQVALNKNAELWAEDGDTWATTLQANYPTGYNGFYTMKYEVSQDQYVRFLNKLQLRQQKMRTIGEDMDNVQVGNYVYGSDRSVPAARNGIILGARLNNQLVFANDLNKMDDPAQDGDGQTIACNFLSPADMLAYADWTGLRPLSEMEYEKMARRPFPYEARLGEWAWNSNAAGSLKIPQGAAIDDEGFSTESVAHANVNAGNKISGPLRTGAFAKSASTQEAAGASFFGVMELSGNLAEIYYNLNAGGRPFQGYHINAMGNGVILNESHASKPGDTDISTGYWPFVPAAFALRGGCFSSEPNNITISDRTYNTYFSNINQKDSTVTFRLGSAYPELYPEKCTTNLVLENGRTGTSNGSAIDSLCVGQTYTIRGSFLMKTGSTTPMNVPGKLEYVWYVSNETSRNWEVIPNERGKDLTYSNFYNHGRNVRPLYFKRKTITPTYESETPYVIIRIINNEYETNSLKDTIYANNAVMGLWVETTAPADFTWKWKAGGYNSAPLKKATKGQTFDYYFPEREHFNDIANQTHYIQCIVKLLKNCVRKIDYEIYVKERPVVGIITSEITMGGADPRKECGVLMQDNRDGEIYGTVKIGGQCWMSENLRYSGISGAYFDPVDPTGQKLGALYSWSTAIRDNTCPTGWRMPDNADFTQLKTFLNADGYDMAGQKMRAGGFWGITSANKQFMGTNVSGFNAVGANSRTTSYFRIFNGQVFGVSVGNATLSGPSGYYNSRASIRCIKR